MFDNEDDIQRALKAALAAEPSAGFEDRVAQRISAEPSRRPPVPGNWLAAAAALTLAAGTWLTVQPPSSPPAQPVAVVDPQPEPPRYRPQPHASIKSAPPLVGRRGLTSGIPSARSSRRPSDPEVLVPAAQLAAIQKLVRDVNAGRPAVPEPPGAPTELTPIDVAPLTVAPIPVSSLEPAESLPGAKGVQ